MSVWIDKYVKSAEKSKIFNLLLLECLAKQGVERRFVALIINELLMIHFHSLIFRNDFSDLT